MASFNFLAFHLFCHPEIQAAKVSQNSLFAMDQGLFFTGVFTKGS
jgi:hypothetical protein